MIREAIAKLVLCENLSQKESISVMSEIMNGEATEAQIAGFITAMRMKGETVEEITGCAKVMREHATKINTKTNTIDIDRDDINIDNETIVDTCGTGGDKTNTFNISTAAAFIASGAGIKIAKHGNRAVSSKCGSADVLLALGIKIEVTPNKVEECIEKIGIGFLYAPILHGAMKYAIGPRRQLGIRTIFNLLGPLSNPASANAQVLGVYSAQLTQPMAEVLKNLGVKCAFVVHGKDAMDEITTTGDTQVSELFNFEIKTYNIKPEDFGIKRVSINELAGGDEKENAKIIVDILNGTKGAKRDVACINAAAAIVAGGLANNLSNGLALAYKSIDSGCAKEKLSRLIEITNS